VQSAIEPGRLTVEEVSDYEQLLGVAPEWRALAQQSASDGFFQSWDWTSTWLEAFQRTDRVKCLLVRDGGRGLVGVLPLLPQGLGALRQAGLRAAANDETPVCGVSCSGDIGAVVHALLQHLVATRSRLRLTIPQVRVGSPFHEALLLHASALGLGRCTREARRSLVVHIRSTWDDYLETRSKHLQKEWRRKRRRLEEAGRVEIVTVTSAEDLDRVLPHVRQIEQQSWKEERGSSLSSDPAGGRFYAELARKVTERGWLRLYILYLSGQPVAHILGVAYAGELLALKTSYDAAFHRLSPGSILMLVLLEDAFRGGCSVVDFLGSPTRWKAEMSNGERAHLDVCLFRRGLIDCEGCAFIEARVKPFVRARIPWLLLLKKKVVESVRPTS